MVQHIFHQEIQKRLRYFQGKKHILLKGLPSGSMHQSGTLFNNNGYHLVTEIGSNDQQKSPVIGKMSLKLVVYNCTICILHLQSPNL